MGFFSFLTGLLEGVNFEKLLKDHAVRASDVPPVRRDDGSGVAPGQVIEAKFPDEKRRGLGIVIAAEDGHVYFLKIDLKQTEGAVSFTVEVPLAAPWWVSPGVWVARRDSVAEKSLSIGSAKFTKLLNDLGIE